jgi:pimeloyl-ACP methyl ester carboxylesterase
MQLSFRAPDAADIMLAPVFVIKEIKTMNRLIRASTTSLMFKPPLPRPLLSSFKPDESNCLFKTIDDDFMHCCLVCPYGQETSLKNFDDNGQLLLFFHGNADDIISSHSYCKWLADRLRMCVLVCDYPGYGFSSGEPSEEKMEHAALALMDFATTKLRKKPADVYVMGKSIGSYPAVCVASHPAFKDIRGLILVSPVASAARCVFEVKYLPDFIVQRLDAVALANIKRIGEVRALVLAIHGSADDVVSVDNTHALIAASSPDTYYPPLIVDAGHNDIECKFQSLFLETLHAFVKRTSEELLLSAAYEPYDSYDLLAEP